VGEVGRLDRAREPEVAEPRGAEEPRHRPPEGRDAPPARRPPVGAGAEEVRDEPPLGPRVAEEVPPPERRPEPGDVRGGVAGRDQRGDEGADGRARDLDDGELEALERLEGPDVGVAPGLAAGEGHVDGGAPIRAAPHRPRRPAGGGVPGRSAVEPGPGIRRAGLRAPGAGPRHAVIARPAA
jgi:hypothetical protein